eukprot:scaffold130030_cov30-Tisochrysis_lutea.AAC.2
MKLSGCEKRRHGAFRGARSCTLGSRTIVTGNAPSGVQKMAQMSRLARTWESGTTQHTCPWVMNPSAVSHNWPHCVENDRSSLAICASERDRAWCAVLSRLSS